jgi:hypothetical protein
MFCDYPGCTELATHYNELSCADELTQTKYRIYRSTCAAHYGWAIIENKNRFEEILKCPTLLRE